MIKQRYVELQSKSEDIILKLIDTCVSLDIDNVSFDLDYDTKVCIGEYVPYWEIVVIEREANRDIYRVDKGKMTQLEYQYSESDRDL